VPAGGSRSRWGWYRLTDAAARRFVAEAEIRPGELVVDLGAGTGTLTRHLVAAEAEVLAVELHAARAQSLRERFADDDVKVIESSIDDLRLPHRPFRVVANPPFSRGADIVRRLTHPRTRLVQADLVLPIQVAQRWGRHPSARVAGRLPRHAFRPASPVPTAVLRIRPIRRR
jgi:23S rRNA (adenine-N6)-dimethyltransferase